MDNIDGLVQDVIDSTNESAKSIKETLEKEVTGVGGLLSEQMQSIWDGTGKNVVGDGINTVSTTLTDIKNLVAKMVSDSNVSANSNVKDAQTSVKPTTTVNSTVSKPSTTNNPSSSNKVITIGGMIDAGNAPIYDYAGDTTPERAYFRSQPYYRVLDERNGYLKVRHQSLSSGTTGWFKKSDVKAYATGGKVDYTGLAMVHGSKSKPELMLNAKDTENFIQLKDALSVVAKTNMFDAIGNYAKLPNFVPNGNIQNSGGDVIFEKIEMYGVNDPQEFAKQLKDVYDRNVGNVRKMINTDVHSKYGSHNYRRYL